MNDSECVELLFHSEIQHHCMWSHVMPFSVHRDKLGVERLSHISIAMAVHFLLIYAFFQFQKWLFTQMLCTIFLSNYPANIQSTSFNFKKNKKIKNLWTQLLLYILMQILPYLCLQNYCRILIKFLNWCDVMYISILYLWGVVALKL